MEHEQQFEELAKKWPDLFQKCQIDDLGVDEGWHHILDVLFGALSHDVERAKQQLKYAMENPKSKYLKTIDELESDLKLALEDLPTIVQIKEKFGGLRVYTNGTNEKHGAYITFASAMADRTCEMCGSPGSRRGGGWIKTLCNIHHNEREEAEKNIGSKLFGTSKASDY